MILGYWELPKPPRGEERNWHTIARVSFRYVPFGYKVNPDNERLLEPIARRVRCFRTC